MADESRIENVLDAALGEPGAVVPSPPFSRIEEKLIELKEAIESGGEDTYTKTETDALLTGKADLVGGKVLASQLPSYVDDVLEYESINSFPVIGESGKIYVATNTNKTYRWSGSGYIEISESLALGETSSTAYPGNKGKANADAIAKKPGEITTGKQYVIGGKTVTAGTGAEAFNDLNYNKAAGPYSHAEGQGTTASVNVAHAEGQGTTASGTASHAEGQSTTASGTASHAEGQSTTAASSGAHAEGQRTTASGQASHAEGQGTNAGSDCAHAEGRGTTAANGECTHAEGSGSKAVANSAHAEGEQTTAAGQASHTEGVSTVANGKGAHAEGQGTTAYSDYSHAEGMGTTALSACQHVQGRYNVEDGNSPYAFIIGNGTSSSARHNAFAIDWNGLIYVNGAATGVNVATLATDLAALTARVESLDEQIGTINTVLEEVL